jgi:hypothetical protein
MSLIQCIIVIKKLHLFRINLFKTMPVASGQSGRLPVDFPFPLKRDILFGIFYTVDTSENYRRLPAFTIGVIWGKKKT